MKNLNEFKAFELPSEILTFLKGGAACAHEDEFDDCAATAERDGNYWLISTCYDVLC